MVRIFGVFCCLLMSVGSLQAAVYWAGASINFSSLSNENADFDNDTPLGLSLGRLLGDNYALGFTYISDIGGSATTANLTYDFYNASQFLFSFNYYFSKNTDNGFYIPLYFGILDLEVSRTRVGNNTVGSISGGETEFGAGLGVGYQYLVSEKHSFYVVPEASYIFGITAENPLITNFSLNARIFF